jgi:hypothetical protein
LNADFVSLNCNVIIICHTVRHYTISISPYILLFWYFEVGRFWFIMQYFRYQGFIWRIRLRENTHTFIIIAYREWQL